MRVDKVSEYKGHQILIVNTGHGTYNGYVSVPDNHPMRGVSYQDEEFFHNLHCCCNGGVTFTGTLNYEEATEGWYIGFDNMHHRDKGSEELFKEYNVGENGFLYNIYNMGCENSTFKTMEMTEADCKALIDGLLA